MNYVVLIYTKTKVWTLTFSKIRVFFCWGGGWGGEIYFFVHFIYVHFTFCTFYFLYILYMYSDRCTKMFTSMITNAFTNILAKRAAPRRRTFILRTINQWRSRALPTLQER